MKSEYPYNIFIPCYNCHYVLLQKTLQVLQLLSSSTVFVLRLPGEHQGAEVVI